MELSKQLSLQYPVSSGQQHRTTGSTSVLIRYKKVHYHTLWNSFNV